jgi:hypothetical protein
VNLPSDPTRSLERAIGLEVAGGWGVVVGAVVAVGSEVAVGPPVSGASVAGFDVARGDLPGLGDFPWLTLAPDPFVAPPADDGAPVPDDPAVLDEPAVGDAVGVELEQPRTTMASRAMSPRLWVDMCADHSLVVRLRVTARWEWAIPRSSPPHGSGESLHVVGRGCPIGMRAGLVRARLRLRRWHQDA